MTNPLPALAATPTIARFRNDLHRRFPDRAMREATWAELPDQHQVATKLAHRLEKLPPEIGVLLIVLGTAGVLLPGPVGSPFLIAGGIALWPAAFRRTEGWFQRVAPGLYDEGIRQLERFLADLERRYPGSTR